MNVLLAAISICTFVFMVGGYAVSIETRFGEVERALDIDERVANLERMLFPLLVEMKMREVQTEAMVFPPAPQVVGADGVEAPAPAEMPPPPEQMVAEEWAEQQIQRAAPQFRKEMAAP
jgi:hypothetical protein